MCVIESWGAARGVRLQLTVLRDAVAVQSRAVSPGEEAHVRAVGEEIPKSVNVGLHPLWLCPTNRHSLIQTFPSALGALRDMNRLHLT